MRIVYISTPSFFDSENPLIKEFEACGHDVFWFIRISPYSLKSTYIEIDNQIPESCILPGERYTQFSRFSKYIDLSRLFIINDTNGKICRDTFRLHRELIGRIDEINPDVVHFVGNPDLLDTSLFVRFSKKLVVTVHDPLPHTGESCFRLQFFRRALFRFASRFVLLNGNLVDSFCKEYSLDKSKVRVSRLGLYNLVNIFRSKTEPEIAGKYILFYGRISPYKGLDYLVSAMDNLAADHKDVSLVIAGKGKLTYSMPERGYLKIFNRYIQNEELVNLVTNSMFVVCPYTDATQSGVVSTVLALGIPMVVTDTGTMGDMVRDFNAGIVVPPKDSASLEAAMRTLLDNPDKLDNFRSSIAGNSVAGKYSWSVIASEYIDTYKSIKNPDSGEINL